MVESFCINFLSFCRYQFKASKFDARIVSENGGLGLPKRAVPKTTVPMPMRLATEKKVINPKQDASAGSSSFKAQPIPDDMFDRVLVRVDGRSFPPFPFWWDNRHSSKFLTWYNEGIKHTHEGIKHTQDEIRSGDHGDGPHFAPEWTSSCALNPSLYPINNPRTQSIVWKNIKCR